MVQKWTKEILKQQKKTEKKMENTECQFRVNASRKTSGKKAN